MKGNSTSPVSQLNLPSFPKGGVDLSDLAVAKISEVAAEVTRLNASGAHAFLHIGDVICLRVSGPLPASFLGSFSTKTSCATDVISECDQWLNELLGIERILKGGRA